MPDVPHPRFSSIRIQVPDPPSPPPQPPTMRAVRRPPPPSPALLLADDPYGSTVAAMLNYIAGSSVGGIILTAIQNSGRTMKIKPYPANERLNADATPADWSAATPAGRTAMSCGGPTAGQPVTNQVMMFGISVYSSEVTGTGRGSDTTVRFSPNQWNAAPGMPPSTGRQSGPGSRGDEVLFHEMLHGLRMMAGTLQCTAETAGYDTFEEFFAIVISNMYASEVLHAASQPLHNHSLRASHSGFTPLSYPSLFPDSAANRERCRRIQREMPDLVTRLGLHAHSDFNPFRDLYIRTAPEFSRTSAPA